MRVRERCEHSIDCPACKGTGEPYEGQSRFDEEEGKDIDDCEDCSGYGWEVIEEHRPKNGNDVCVPCEVAFWAGLGAGKHVDVDGGRYVVRYSTLSGEFREVYGDSAAARARAEQIANTRRTCAYLVPVGDEHGMSGDRYQYNDDFNRAVPYALND